MQQHIKASTSRPTRRANRWTTNRFPPQGFLFEVSAHQQSKAPDKLDRSTSRTSRAKYQGIKSCVQYARHNLWEPCKSGRWENIIRSKTVRVGKQEHRAKTGAGSPQGVSGAGGRPWPMAHSGLSVLCVRSGVRWAGRARMGKEGQGVQGGPGGPGSKANRPPNGAQGATAETHGQKGAHKRKSSFYSCFCERC